MGHYAAKHHTDHLSYMHYESGHLYSADISAQLNNIWNNNEIQLCQLKDQYINS